ncbi:MAG: hypothetical protein ACMUHU_04930 [Thermoplasmatota archaeon]
MNRSTFTIIIIVAAMIVPGLGALITYSLMNEPQEGNDISVETRELTQQLSTLTHAQLSSLEESALDEIEVELSRDISLWVSSSRITMEDHRVTVLESRVKASQVDLQVKVPVPPASLEGDLGRFMTNSLLYGGTGTLPLLPGIRTDVEVDVLIEPLDGSGSFEETVSFTTEVVDPERGLLKLIQLLEADMNGHGSGMARDMEYMLTTLARYRSNGKFGDQSYQSDLNVLNEGDVELAFNIALALRITRWTGQVPGDLVETIDSFFKDQHPNPEMNPSGFRFWGQAEINNFNSFYLGNLGTGARRSIGDIIEGAVETGHADSADLFGRYLSMDRKYPVSMNALDMGSPLAEGKLLNPREISDLIDSTSLAHHPSYPNSDGILVLPRDNYLKEEEAEAPSLIPRLEPAKDYLVVGRDIRLKDFDEVEAWFTNANNSLTISDLISDSGGRRSSTRCGSIPPPPKPADHDFRLEWNFDINGLFDVTATYEGFGGNAPLDRDSIERSIMFSFPVRVHTWFPGRPVNDMAYDYVNINAGRLFWNDTATGWIITGEANATEFYEDQVHPRLKEGFSALTGLLRTLEWYQQVPVLDDAAVRRLAHSLAMSTEQQLSDWTVNGYYKVAADKFWEYYIDGPGVKPEDLKKVWIEGHHMKFQYSELKDVLHITSLLPAGSVKLSIFGMKIGAYKVEAQVTTSNGLVIDIRPYTDEYSIRGDIGDHFVNEGTLYPNIPDPSITSLLIEGGWTISTPPMELQAWDVPSPYALPDNGDEEENLTLSFILAGPSRIDPLELYDEAQQLIEVPARLGESQVSIILGKLALLSMDMDIWFGLRVTSIGSGTAHPFSRTFLMNPENGAAEEGKTLPDTVSDLMSSGRLNCLVRDLAWGVSADPVIEGFGNMETILLEEVPSWTSSGSMIGAGNMLYSTYTEIFRTEGAQETIQVLNVVADENPSSGLYHPSGSEWRLSSFGGLSILW